MEQINEIHIRGVIGFARVHDIGDTEVARFSVCTSHAYQDKGGTMVIENTWYSVVAFKNGRMPDFSALVKGAMADVKGRLRFITYTNASGDERRDPEILADEVTLV